MPTEIFVKVTGDDGTETYEPVSDWNGVEIPEEKVKTSPVYKQVLDESVKRRQTIAALKAQVDALGKEEDADDDTPAPQKPEPSGDGLQFNNREELLNFVFSGLEQRSTAHEQAQQLREANLMQLITKHNLSTDALPILRESNNPEQTAAYIGQKKLRFDDVSGGGEQRTLSVENIRNKVAASLNLSDK